MSRKAGICPSWRRRLREAAERALRSVRGPTARDLLPLAAVGVAARSLVEAAEVDEGEVEKETALYGSGSLWTVTDTPIAQMNLEIPGLATVIAGSLYLGDSTHPPPIV